MESSSQHSAARRPALLRAAFASFGSGWGASLLGLIILLVFLFPVYWMVKTSLESTAQIFHDPPYLIPIAPNLDAFGQALHGGQGGQLVHSLIISLGTVAVGLLLGAPAAYAMAHLRLRWTLPIVLLLLLTQMFPTVMLAMPLFLIYNKVQFTVPLIGTGFTLLNSYPGLILADSTYALPFVILVLRAYLLTVPYELTEAAQVDGTGLLGAFTRVILPVALPGIATASLFSFLFGWGDFTFALTLTTPGTDITPVTLGLQQFIGQHGTDWQDLMATAVLAALPAAAILVAAQRFISAGLTAGAVKG